MARRYCAWISVLCLVSAGLAAEIDDATGLVVDQDWELVRASCIACHSLKLVTAQRATRQTWLDLIHWMQRTQNLWQFDAGVETRIVDYLAKHYPPDASRPRPVRGFPGGP